MRLEVADRRKCSSAHGLDPVSVPGSCVAALLLTLLALGAAAGTGTTDVRDAAGRRVTLDAPASRIVALAPHIVENLFAIGAGDRVVGAVAYSDYPDAAKHIERVGGVSGLSLERIVALQPDLVIAWQSGTRGDILAVLDRLAIPYYVDEIRSLAALSRSLRHLGALTGRQAEANAQARRLDRLGPESSEGAPTRAPGLFIQIWDDPLQSIGRRHLLTEVIARCGGRSVTANLPGLAPRVSLEAVLEADPALIVVESHSQGEHWSRFPELQAVAQDRIRQIDPDLLYRPTLRLLDGMTILCREISVLR